MKGYETIDTLNEPLEISSELDTKVHPWRICPIGKHLVRTHILHVPPSKEHPEGQTVIRHEHCAENPSHKDLLSYDEIQAMTKAHFSNLSNLPKTCVLSEFSRADEFDLYIAGWVRYWNEIFLPKEPLDPNLVKALIASESSFKPEQITKQNSKEKHKKIGYARGLMQITDSTLSIIRNHEGEVKNHLINISNTEVLDPSANICIGVRWLITKKAIAAERLKGIATWDQTVVEYKGVLKGILDKKNKKPDTEGKMPKFHSLYDRFQGS